jgi:integrase
MIVEFTQALTRELPAPSDGKPYLIHYDGKVRGLGLRVTRNGARSWIFNYRVKGLERRLTIGAIANWPLKVARDEARRLRRLVDQGHDPMAERQAARAASTVRELFERWRTEKAPSMRPRSKKEYESLFRQWIEPELGNRKVADITHADIDRLHRKITSKGRQVRANRVVSFLARLFNLSIVWKMRADTPVKAIEKNAEQPRHRYLTEDELGRLNAALIDDPDRQTCNIVQLLLATGARKSEALAMRWDHLELGAAAVWTKPASATKQAKIHRVPLNDVARHILLAIKAAQSGSKVTSLSPFVFPARNELGHVRDIKRGWERICNAAGLVDFRIHDLRHSFASLLISEGESLSMVGALLGHSQAQTTSRYAHLIDSAQRRATERLGALIRGSR